MSYFEAVILGLVQGLAEFLPISSSGHLALLQQAFGVSEDKVLLFAVLLHVGTLISVFIVYWKDIWALIVELCLTIKDLCTGKGLRLAERPVRKLGVMIIVATIPTAVIGLAFSDFFDSLYTSVIPIGVGLIITGFLLVLAEKMGATYVTAGHIFATDCKKGLEPRGIEFLKNAVSSVDIDVYGIGGISLENISKIQNTGAKGACIMSGFMKCDNVKKYLDETYKNLLKK